MCPRGRPRGQGRPRGLHLWPSVPTYARDALEVNAVWLLLVTKIPEVESRTQGSRPRTQKILGQGQPFRSIGVARILDWGGPKPQITCNDVIRNFQKRNFLWGKAIVEWKI